MPTVVVFIVHVPPSKSGARLQSVFDANGLDEKAV